MDPPLHQKRKNSLNNGLNPANLLQRRQKRFHRPEDHGHRFLGFARHHFHRLFGEGKDNHGTVLCWFIGSILRWIEEKTASFSEKKVLFHHDNASVHSSVIAMAKLIELRYELLSHPPYYILQIWPPAIFIYFQTWLGGKLCIKWGSHRRNRDLF